jgi:hypothetical protein
MRHVPAHPASPRAAGQNDEAPLVTDLSQEELEHDARCAIGDIAYAYYARGSGNERLLRGNVELAARGASAVVALLHWFEVELKRALALCGAGSVQAIDDSLIRQAPGWSLEPDRR